MTASDAWHLPAAPPVVAADGRLVEPDLAAILRRAALLGIPPWRVMTALGLCQS